MGTWQSEQDLQIKEFIVKEREKGELPYRFSFTIADKFGVSTTTANCREEIQYVGCIMARIDGALAKKHRRSLKALYQAMAEKRFARHKGNQSKIGQALRAANEGSFGVTVMYSYPRISRMSLFVLEGQTIRRLLPPANASQAPIDRKATCDDFKMRVDKSRQLVLEERAKRAGQRAYVHRHRGLPLVVHYVKTGTGRRRYSFTHASGESAVAAAKRINAFLETDEHARLHIEKGLWVSLNQGTCVATEYVRGSERLAKKRSTLICKYG